MKKLLVLGGNYIECDLIKEAQQMGYYVIVTDNHEDWRLSPGKAIANEAWNVSWSDFDTLKIKCKEENIQGVLAGFSEFRVENMIKLCNYLDLPCSLTLEQLEITRNKILFKKACRDSNLPTINEYSINDDITFPVIIKPVDRAGSIGINVANNESELKEYYNYALSLSPSKQVIIEDYITDGIKFDIYYYVLDSDIYFLGSSDTIMCSGNLGNKFLQKAWTFPSIYEEYFKHRYDNNIRNLFKVLNIKNCYVTLSAFYRNKEFYFFEAGFRLSGELSYNYYNSISGYNYLNHFISFAMGDKSVWVNRIPDKKFSIILNFFGLNGKVAKINDSILDDFTDFIKYNIYISIGDCINNTTKNLKKIAMITVFSSNISDLLLMVNKINNNFDIISEEGESLIYEKTSLDDFDFFLEYFKS